MKLKSRFVDALVTALAVAAAVTLPTSPAEAASSVRFSKIYYDSPGTDTRSNTSLNAEYIVIKNYSTTTKTLTGWKVRDITGYTYTLGTFRLGAGKAVIIRTGKGTNTSTTRYWGRSNYVWNNTTDKAYLKNSSGTTVDTCGYPDTTKLYIYC